jgi:hypothetical protein
VWFVSRVFVERLQSIAMDATKAGKIVFSAVIGGETVTVVAWWRR